MPTAKHRSRIEEYISMGRCDVIVFSNTGAIFFVLKCITITGIQAEYRNVHLKSFFVVVGGYFI